MRSLADQVLESVIKTYENDICYGLGGTERYAENRQAFADLIVYMIRDNMGIRYCSDDKCLCSPISNLAHHVKKNRELFKEHLSHNAFSLLDDLSTDFLGRTAIEPTEQA